MQLGDPLKKVASKASYLLGRLLEAHPVMARVVVAEVDSFVFRPGIKMRAQHYAAVFLNQIILSRGGDGPAVARQLIDLYFALFKTLTAPNRGSAAFSAPDGAIKEGEGGKGKGRWKERGKMERGGKGSGKGSGKGRGKGSGKGHKVGKGKGRGSEESPGAEEQRENEESALLSALLTGVNRAFPFVSVEEVEGVVEEHTPVLFRMAHSTNFNLAVQALVLLQHLLSRHNALSSRFYRALYSVLLSPALAKSSKSAMFLALVYRSMKSDVDPWRTAAFVKRLLQVALQQPATFAAGVLLIVSEILKFKPMLWEAIKEREGSGDDDLEHFIDVDTITQSDTPHSEAVYSDRAPGHSDDTNQGREGSSGSAGMPAGSLERGVEGEEGREGEERGEEGGGGGVGVGAMQNGLANGGVSSYEGGKRRSEKDKRYSLRARDPSLCNADGAGWWELEVLATHSHPTVAAMASSLLFGTPIVFGGDPLRDLTLSVFLNKFAEKKPKRSPGMGKTEREASRGASLMQPMSKVRKTSTAAQYCSVN